MGARKTKAHRIKRADRLHALARYLRLPTIAAPPGAPRPLPVVMRGRSWRRGLPRCVCIVDWCIAASRNGSDAVCLALPPKLNGTTNDPASIAHAIPAALRLTSLPAQLLWRRCRRCRHRCGPIAGGDGPRERPARHGANRYAGVHGNGERQHRPGIPAQPRAR
ncbi:hypothetical protein XFF6992_360083 [Xanthomonas citri pv. fuscans]|nr:hypothetical protein XFF6992_360083 [Xanthomonas citri pv. fuscans]SOO33608.1 hypothetical protein XFF6994_3010030 [Xanthomonas citri pv. fuscans]